MDNASIVRAEQGTDARNGMSTSPGGTNQGAMPAGLNKSPAYTNGVSQGAGHGNREHKAPSTKFALRVNGRVPDLPHITQGFFPFSTLVNRSVQQCWNDLSDLITELAEIQIPSHDGNTLAIPANGKLSGNQSSENIQKKVRVLEFAHAKRAEFIKLLVLSQWSRQAADVSKLIDLQNFIRSRHQSYVSALQWIGDLKRNLVQAQVANPDLKTALEVLSKAKIMSMPDPGYKPPRPLTAKCTLKKLRKIDRILSARLSLCDIVPRPLQTFHIHDGRVTFIVLGEFELDLSIGEADESSQFYFVDIRFLFHPSASVPQGRMFNDLESKINDTLRNGGLTGCFDLLHSLVLTNKINILFKQALELARGLWSNVLRIELLHRTLVVHYWALKSGTKSWLEIGVKRGHRRSLGHSHGIPYLGLRWLRDGQEIDSADVEFDTVNLSMESALRSVIALHTSHILFSAHNILSQSFLFAAGMLNLQTQLTGIEPGDCQLDVQLTSSRYLRVSIEPMSGAIVLSARPSALERPEGERSPERTTADDIVSRVSRLRCIAAIEEIETHVRLLGFEPVNPRGLKIDVRRVFPVNVIRFSFFWHPFWERNWIVAATSSMDGDNWWVIQLLPPTSTEGPPTHDIGTLDQSMPRTAQIISRTLFPLQEQISYASFADIGHCLSGILAIYANARYMAGLQSFSFRPPLHKLALGSGFQVPDVYIRYNPASLPSSFQLALPGGSKTKGLIKDTIRLAFHGVEPRSKVAIMVAYGSLLIPAKAFSSLSTKWDRSLVFLRRGRGFAIRLLAPPGRPVIISLMENLQRLECVLSIFETLQRRRMAPQSLSLSRIAFAYGPERSLSSHIDIQTLSRTNADPADVSSQTHPMFYLHLSINFGCANPHRRIQGPLTSILNNSSADTSIDTVTELLSLTLPLMQAFDLTTTNRFHQEHLKMQVIVRNASTFIIHYPNQNVRFQLKSGGHKTQMVWILRDVNSPQDPSANKPLESDFKTRLFNSKGDGWKGLGSGVVAEAEKVGNFILELDRWLTSGRNNLATKYDLEAKAAGSGDSIQPRASEQAGSENTGNGPAMPAVPVTRMSNKNVPPETDAASGSSNADIIMID
ncbi:mediator of RNA polymerase II transcription subunit 14 [Aspergillus steynii IBT 23096]|uniref:Mediator of RNA polymerase II transcription subunit 14 n=1 Tax=Aspergillus steynii IBT 23096 TaxID=1392250 RepID=A0A2I2GCA9_9EURO|nr:mediator of RNA polymerase II transcription subunit 14 [Aspergillus steynii IBT 23096]PLB50495.1 mediator of RNA polymerase II transcription subunit 14 [Aspergillus steynii IBT 23096]